MLDVFDTEVEFTNTSTFATEYDWDFGGVNTHSSITHPTHIYPVANGGTYEVILIAANSACEDTAYATIFN